jgi:hypothetical protein
METLKNILKNLAIIVPGALVAGLLINGVYKTDIHRQIWREAAFVADRHGDNNKVISQEEYATIYKTLKLKDTGRSAIDLTNEQLQDYISIKKLEDYRDTKEKAGLGGLF